MRLRRSIIRTGSLLSALVGLGLAAAPALAADGTGTMSVQPAYVIAGSSENFLTFTYTADQNGMNGGALSLTVPSGWTPPSTMFNPGGVGGSCGSDSTNGAATESGQVITVSGLTLSPGQTCTIEYGISGLNSGDTAPSATGQYTFAAQERSSSTGTLSTLSSGSPVVTAGYDGTGTMTVSPAHVVASSTGNTLTFTYTATAAMSDGDLTLGVPNGWSTPSTSGTDPGYTTSTCGTVSITAGPTIQVSGVYLAASASCTVTYGDQGGGGPGATAPSTGGPTPSTFTTTQEAAASDDNPVALTSSPQVSVTATDGAGTIEVSPPSVNQGSTGNDLTFTYTAPPGGLDNGEISILVPNGWTTPSTQFNPGGVGGSCASDTPNGPSFVAVSGGTEIQLTGLSLSNGDTCTIDYGVPDFNSGDTAPSSPGQYTFTTQEASTATGTLTGLTTQPVVDVGTDGTGSMTVSPGTVLAGSTGNTLTFTYTAATNVSGGELTLGVPAGWSAPSTTASAAGATTATCGAVGVSGSTIQITGVNLADGDQCTITYGSQAGGPGATAPSSGGPTPYTFTVQEESSSSGYLTSLSSPPEVYVSANDGTGTMTVSPATVVEGSGGNDVTFTYTAPQGGLVGGQLSVLVPSAWTTPSGIASPGGVGGTCVSDSPNGAPTFATAQGGTEIQVSGVSLSGGQTCTIQYGIKGVNSGDAAPSTAGPSTFTTQEASTATGTLTSLSTQPVVTVSTDGTGTMTVAPSTALAGSAGNTLTFTYTAGAAVSNGALTVAVPSEWSVPSTTSSAPGATTSTCGSVGVSSSTIQVTGVTLSDGDSCTITYGDQTSGPGAQADSNGGPTPDQFTTQEKSSLSGTLTTLASGSPAVRLHALDGTGTMTVSPTTAVGDSTDNDFNFTYTAPAGGVVDGTLTLLVPTGWTTPSGTASDPGGVNTTCNTSGVTVSGASGGSLITVAGVSLEGGSTCQIFYGLQGFNSGVTAPSSSGKYPFTAQEASSSGGTLTGLSSSPAITVSPNGSGTLAVAPQSESAGAQGKTLTFTYTAANTMADGELTVALPAGWSAPSTTASAAGATTSTCGTVGVSGMTIQVTGVNLSSGVQCTITYGDTSSGGPGATVTATMGASQFQAQQLSGSAGSLTDLTSSPQTMVYAPDGSGIMTADPAYVGPGSVGNTFTFTYTAASGGMNGGQLLVPIPSGWSPPSTTPQVAGYSTSTCGSVSIISQAIKITGVNLAGGRQCTITYGDTSRGGTGATVSSTSGSDTLNAQEASSASGGLAQLADPPSVNIISGDGSGAMSVAPGDAVAGTSANTLTFTYRAAPGGTYGGELQIAVPSGWSTPSTSASAPGFATSDCGQLATSGSSIQVTGMTLTSGGTCTVVYGSTAGGGPGATAPTSQGVSTFSTTEASTAGGALTALSGAPSVTVYPAETLSATVKGKGMVAGDGISCPGRCSGTYMDGTGVSLTAKPDPGFEFAGWSGACTGTGACLFTITKDETVSATFTAIPVCLVPRLKGDTLARAEQLIKNAHCAVGKVTQPAHSNGQQLVVGSTSPTAGAKRPAGTKLAITLVKRAATACVVPKVKRDTLARAEKLIRAAHCSVGKVTKPAHSKGHQLVVGSTSPPAGRRLSNGAKVAIKLTEGKKK